MRGLNKEHTGAQSRCLALARIWYENRTVAVCYSVFCGFNVEIGEGYEFWV